MVGNIRTAINTDSLVSKPPKEAAVSSGKSKSGSVDNINNLASKYDVPPH